MARIIIIGAGLTGLSAAYHLEKKGFDDFTIFEKEQEIGGLCRSVTQDGFTFDFTGHLLHINDPYFKEFVTTIVGIDKFNTIFRRSYVYSQNTYTSYPYQINLHGLPIQTIAQCIAGYVQRKKSRKKSLMFKDWVNSHFGAGFGKHFFFPYQKKIFAYPLHKLTADWTGRFVPETSLEQIIQGVIHPCPELIGYNSQFFYPKQGGIVSWVNDIAHHLHTSVHLDFCVQNIDMQKKIVQFKNGHEEHYDQLISTMPLDILLSVIKDKPTTSLKNAMKYLRCNSVVNFNLGIAQENISDKHWIYFPESQFPFYRLGFAHNFATSMAPAGCSSIYGEFAHIGKSSAWVADMLKKSLQATKKLLTISDEEIITKKIMHISHAYVIYDRWRQQNLPSLLNALAQENIYSVGRYGQWKYASMQEAVLDGKKIADNLVIMPATKSWLAPEVTPSHGKEIQQ